MKHFDKKREYAVNEKEFLNNIEEILEIDENTLTGSELLDDLEDWDSLAVMGFIAMVDTHFSQTIEAKKINQCKTINDLASLLDNHISN